MESATFSVILYRLKASRCSTQSSLFLFIIKDEKGKEEIEKNWGTNIFQCSEPITFIIHSLANLSQLYSLKIANSEPLTFNLSTLQIWPSKAYFIGTATHGEAPCTGGFKMILKCMSNKFTLEIYTPPISKPNPIYTLTRL